MPTSLENLRSERRRKLQVRESFSRGLAFFRASGADPLPFYLACGEYLAAGQRRLIDQDGRLVDMLAPRVPAAQAQDHDAIRMLRERLALAARSLADFEAALGSLRRRGAVARKEFEEASERFLDLLVNVLGARSHSLRHLTTTLLDEGDWRQIVDCTPEFEAAESAAYAAVSRLAPPGLAPDGIDTQPAGR
ncbi:MAG: hypothetical protein QY320_10140 [Gammaproteobacteria bacterium]|nr:MAG: hypothetical protein QY320_10140 [Gammaproteobacteria bacterium]